MSTSHLPGKSLQHPPHTLTLQCQMSITTTYVHTYTYTQDNKDCSHLPENNSLLGPPSSTAGFPEKPTFSVDLGWIFVDITDLKSCHRNFLLLHIC